MSGSRGRRAPGSVPADLRLLLPALAAWSVGASMLGSGIATLLVTAGASLLLAVLLLWRRPLTPDREGRADPGCRAATALVLAAVALVLTSTAGHTAAREAGPIRALARQHASVDLVGVVIRDPVVVGGRRLDGAMLRLSLRVESVTARGSQARVATPVLVIGGPEWEQVRWHERVRVKGILLEAQPGDDVVAVLRPRGAPRPVARPGLVARAAERLRAGLRDAASALPPDARGLVPALVIGDTSRTPPDLTEAMLATGMTHLSAVSGSNVAIVLALALGAARLAGVSRRWRPGVAALVLAGFVVLARPEPSVLRAAAMGAVGLVGLSRSRRAVGIPVLSAAVIALLVVDPWLSRSYGFALSTLATLGLLLFTRTWAEAIGRCLPRRIRSWGPALAIPVAAQATCAPVVVLLQGSVSLVGVVANLLAAPLVAPATIAGVAAAGLAPVWPTGARLVCWVAALPALGIARVARTCATVPGGTLPWPDGAVGAVLLTLLTVAVLLTGRWWLHLARFHPVLAAAVGILTLATSAPTAAVTWPPSGWRFVACDVGQGDALVLATTRGHAVLVDAGPDPSAVNACLRRLDVQVLDSVVLSHLHADHVDGLPGALAGREVRELLVSPVHEPAYQWAQVQGWARARGIPVRDVQAGDRLGWPGVSADVWWPARRISGGSVPNNASLVLAVRSGPVDLLLLGDVERETAHALLLQLRRDPRMAAVAAGFDVVKVAHHGSGNLDEGLLEEVRAPLGVISVGKDNDYGHPAPKALEVLRRNGYAVLRTDQRGDIAIVAIDDDLGVTWRRH
ncbi:competence protein ComEC [Pedococcus dokdonensis]|uniref:Competence protein ComEC n=1 Tax=Pedococcus dokdonensis TaxID=443156 RepID=A0A1H0MC53_9MICO|nr:ComEC/Rec2 family competence protein [Pedococcus dokdonensis]SDO77730.1 competence protein ComEC [Pedococcus dokdonensis]